MKTKHASQSPKTPSKVEGKTPQIKHHKASGQGYIRIDGRAIYFGKYSLPETQQKYHQFIAEWLARKFSIVPGVVG